MSIAERLDVIVEAKVKAAIRDLKNVDTQMKRTEKSAGDVAKAMLKKAAAAGAAALTVRALISLAKESVAAYGRQIQAETRLAAAIQATGGNVDSLLPQFKSLASEIQGITTVGDEAAIEMMQLATTMGVAHDQVGEVTKGAIGLSKAFGMGTQQAVRGVALAMQGNFEALQRYIPALRTATTDTEKMEAVQKAMADGFKVAEAEAQSGYGALLQLKNVTGDLKEEFGRTIVDGTRPFITALKDLFTQTVKNIQLNRDLANALDAVYGRGTEDSVAGLLNLENGLKELQEREKKLQATIATGDNRVVGYAETALEGLQAQISHTEKLIYAHARQLSGEEALRIEGERAEQELAKLAAAKSEEAAAALSHLNKLKEAYGQTRDGQIEAVKASIAYFETFKDGEMARVVLAMLNEQLEKLNKVMIDNGDTAEAWAAEFLVSSEDKIKALQLEIDYVKKLEEQYGSLAQSFSGVASVMIDTLKETGDIGEAVWQGLQEAAKETFALILEALAKEAVTRAALAAVGGRFVQAAGYTAAAAGAIGSAQAVRSFRSGGVINEPVVGTGQRSGQTYSIGEAGPEEVKPTAQSQGQSSMGGDVYFDGDKVGKWIQRKALDGQISIPKRAVI